jgi:nucleotide-binding universal stress UspA family protein
MQAVCPSPGDPRFLSTRDFSQASDKAFKAAVEPARSFKAELHVIHVVEAEPAIPDLSLEEKALASMDRLVRSAARDDRDRQITTEVTTSSSSVEILNRAQERQVDLIAIGTKGLTLLEEGVFGGTAKRLVSAAPCSVLAVREGDRRTG